MSHQDSGGYMLVALVYWTPTNFTYYGSKQKGCDRGMKVQLLVLLIIWQTSRPTNGRRLGFIVYNSKRAKELRESITKEKKLKIRKGAVFYSYSFEKLHNKDQAPLSVGSVHGTDHS